MNEIEPIISSGAHSMSASAPIKIHTVDQDCLLSQIVAFVNSYDNVQGAQKISIGYNYPDCNNVVPETDLSDLTEVQDFKVLAPGKKRKEVVGGDQIYLKVVHPITAGQMDITIFAHGFKI